MGLVVFILGALLVAAGVALGASFGVQGEMGTALGAGLGCGIVGAGVAFVGIAVLGKSQPAAAPAPAPALAAEPPPPPRPAGIKCPNCGTLLPPGTNRCTVCFPPEAAPAPAPVAVAAPPPPPQPIDPGVARRGRGAARGPNGYLQITEGPDTGKTFTISPGLTITLGRGPDNILVMNDPEVSTRHCQLVCDHDRIDFYDMGSSNGSFLNERQVPPNQAFVIRSGDWLRLGRTTKIWFSYK